MRKLASHAGADGTAPRYPVGMQTLLIRTVSGCRAVPVYSLRNPQHHEPIGRALATGQTAAFYVGLYGIVKAVRAAWVAHDAAETYWRIKAGRPRYAKVPLLAKPQQALRLIDFVPVHPAFRHLARRDRFERLWTSHGAPLHVIAPLRQPLRFLDPAFVTSPADLDAYRRDDARAVDRAVAAPTASFFWMADPTWEDLATFTQLFSTARAFYGASSFNEHGQPPPYTFAQLASYVEGTEGNQFDLVINDELYERTGAFSSHTQVRLPLVDEPAELVVVRRGAVSPEWLADSTGYPVRVLGSAGVASRSPGLTDAELRAGLERLRAWRSA
ncbi:MAG TPA: hypothetical protein VKV26_03190 [Dehalococcoidia bacterium]|nr:hypothetical protein [Dehalococcoidia bacterium]